MRQTLATLLILGLSCRFCQAQQILYSSGFESPEYAGGQLIGQDGWTVVDGAAQPMVTAGSGVGSSRGITTVGTGSFQRSFLPAPISAEQVRVSFDFRMPAGGEPSRTLILGIRNSFYDEAAGIGGSERPDGGGVFAVPPSALLAYWWGSALDVQLAAPNDYCHISVDLNTVFNQATFRINDTMVWQEYTPNFFLTGVNRIVVHTDGTFNFDNIRVETVPEPSTLLPFLISGVCLVRNKRLAGRRE